MFIDFVIPIQHFFSFYSYDLVTRDVTVEDESLIFFYFFLYSLYEFGH